MGITSVYKWYIIFLGDPSTEQLDILSVSTVIEIDNMAKRNVTNKKLILLSYFACSNCLYMQIPVRRNEYEKNYFSAACNYDDAVLL